MVTDLGATISSIKPAIDIGKMNFGLIWWYATEVLKALTPIMIGILTYHVARQQWLTNARKLKLDNFDRRYKIYLHAKKVLNALEGGAKVEQAQLTELHRLADEARWLFSPAKAEFLTTIPKLATNLEAVQKKNENTQLSPKQHKELEDRFDALSGQLDYAFKYLAREFGPDLDLTKV